jgi:chromate reductase, NAD(P)H dehydrogenase (quinone)
MKAVNILAFAGSTRSKSFNHQLILATAKLGNAMDDVTVDTLSLKDFPLPFYDGDLESQKGMPPNALTLKKMITEYDAIVIASPEYNASFSAVLKNTIDWISRPGGDDDPGAVLYEKPVGLLSASPGGLGGIRGLTQLRAVLQNLTTLVVPAQYCLGSAHQAFNDDGTLKDEAAEKAIVQVLDQLVRIVRSIA